MFSGELNCALTHADRTLKYWPYHMNTDNLAIHVREYVHCRLLHAVQQELDETVEGEKCISFPFSFIYFQFYNLITS